MRRFFGGSDVVTWANREFVPSDGLTHAGAVAATLAAQAR